MMSTDNEKPDWRSNDVGGFVKHRVVMNNYGQDL
jgi:hypothetical protein